MVIMRRQEGGVEGSSLCEVEVELGFTPPGSETGLTRGRSSRPLGAVAPGIGNQTMKALPGFVGLIPGTLRCLSSQNIRLVQ